MNILKKISNKLHEYYFPKEVSYSDIREANPLNERFSMEDQIHISHKNEDGVYVSKFCTMKQLIDFIKEN